MNTKELEEYFNSLPKKTDTKHYYSSEEINLEIIYFFFQLDYEVKDGNFIEISFNDRKRGLVLDKKKRNVISRLEHCRTTMKNCILIKYYLKKTNKLINLSKATLGTMGLLTDEERRTMIVSLTKKCRIIQDYISSNEIFKELDKLENVGFTVKKGVEYVENNSFVKVKRIFLYKSPKHIDGCQFPIFKDHDNYDEYMLKLKRIRSLLENNEINKNVMHKYVRAKRNLLGVNSDRFQEFFSDKNLAILSEDDRYGVTTDKYIHTQQVINDRLMRTKFVFFSGKVTICGKDKNEMLKAFIDLYERLIRPHLV